MKPVFTDPVMHSLHSKITAAFGDFKPITPAHHSQHFQRLSESIISQQLAVRAADTIKERVRVAVGKNFEPKVVRGVPIEQLRSAGLSNQKASYIHSIAEYWLENNSQVRSLAQLEDEVIIEMLTTIKGVGRWTAEMFLLSTLGRKDIFSIGDYGLRKAAIKAYGLLEESKPTEILELSQQWQPHRSLASRILWKSLEI
ncbi:MAG: DNA-3-methyladenine glycosylase 2 family protein [Patescibacteria group bacterium]